VTRSEPSNVPVESASSRSRQRAAQAARGCVLQRPVRDGDAKWRLMSASHAQVRIGASARREGMTPAAKNLFLRNPSPTGWQ